MQSAYLKIVGCAIALIITCFTSALAQTSGYRLKIADSLYQAKLYTQSFEHYQEILNQKQYTPAMLLKMAYIQEGLNNIGNAMYYLNLYFKVSNDKAALHKMEELAYKFKLEGYETSDADHFMTLYQDYFNYVSFGLAALCILLLSMVFFTRVRLKRKPYITGSALALFMLVFFVHINFGDRKPVGILSNPQTYIMSGPSPGSSLITIASDGHRVEIVGKKDIWVRITWDGKTAFVREN